VNVLELKIQGSKREPWTLNPAPDAAAVAPRQGPAGIKTHRRWKGRGVGIPAGQPADGNPCPAYAFRPIATILLARGLTAPQRVILIVPCAGSTDCSTYEGKGAEVTR
jgi:hypothetical protein